MFLGPSRRCVGDISWPLSPSGRLGRRPDVQLTIHVPARSNDGVITRHRGNRGVLRCLFIVVVERWWTLWSMFWQGAIGWLVTGLCRHHGNNGVLCCLFVVAQRCVCVCVCERERESVCVYTHTHTQTRVCEKGEGKLERLDNFLLQGQHFGADFYFGIPSTPVLPK